MKSIIKEIIIMLLLCFAIILVMGIIFYEYIPTNKIVPNKVAYQTSDEVKQEIEEKITEETPVNIIYQLDASEMKLYNSVVDTGKQDPFAVYSEQATGDENNISNTTNNTSSNSTTNNAYLPNNGK